eukprot:15365589-Ditylum_brightwellii.AAC.4
MARSKRNRSGKNASPCKRNKGDASIQPPMSNDKTGGNVSSSGIEASSVARSDASGHPDNNPNTTVETSVKDKVAIQGIVGTEGNPIDDSLDKGGNMGKGEKEKEDEKEGSEEGNEGNNDKNEEENKDNENRNEENE